MYILQYIFQENTQTTTKQTLGVYIAYRSVFGVLVLSPKVLYMCFVFYVFMIVRVSSSGKQFQVVDDDGFVFGCPLSFIPKLLSGENHRGFILLTKLPMRVSRDRFQRSPVWNPGGNDMNEEVSVKDDALSSAHLKGKEQSKFFSDKVVW